MAKGYLALVLHAHLPFVRHPEDEFFLEERWLYEAITETYIPLIRAFERLTEDGIPFRLTLSVSPPLVCMLNDHLLQQRYVKHLQKMIELAEKEIQRTKNTPYYATARMYQQRLFESYDTFCHRYHCNLNSAFKKFQDLGRLELITCGATHGYMPLMNQKESIYAQIETAVNIHRKNFGQNPNGIWIPECAYKKGVDEVLKEFGIKFFFTDTHGVLYASRRPRYGVYAPIFCPTGVAAFARDMESSKQVWSASEGYPGDVDYREYYRDIGYDMDEEYIWEYIHPDGIRHNTGFKYYRITGDVDLADKAPYVPEWAEYKVHQHAGNFMFNRERQIEYLCSVMDRRPIIVAPYDAELFGHWWYEGPRWLDVLIRKINQSARIVELISPGDYLHRYPCNQVAVPCESSWGNNGYHHVWLCKENHWIYRHLHEAARRMIELANSYPRACGLLKRALNQAARELMLAQASDWAFIMYTGTTVEYAVRRTKAHLHNFLRLYDMVKENKFDEDWLTCLESTNNIFPEINYRTFRSREAPGAAV
ncbi:1,4-alpha-glucan branching enzyme [Desulfohalotomaculum tongense]|uniref:glycoside hydrolase family 57 protein n=1 Tax=Desulforadius tongensis TaxID=1216062 RepID=UPI00195A8ECF|nr:1,4-alpha-glucan branching protein domain-containing protein [Desulforadius tongensis]MBM7855263.1 1,4-alpha-glucan branching enzyme [Desulforadius tongensis]